MIETVIRRRLGRQNDEPVITTLGLPDGPLKFINDFEHFKATLGFLDLTGLILHVEQHRRERHPVSV